MNWFLTVTFLISFVIYCAHDAGAEGVNNPFKWVVYGLMLALPIFQLTIPSIFRRYKILMAKWLGIFTIFFIFHLIFAHEKPLVAIVSLCSFFTLSVVAVSANLNKATWITLLTILIVTILTTFSYSNISNLESWTGFMPNANTNSVLVFSTLMATILGCKNRKIRWFIWILALIAIIATRSRNALLVYFVLFAASLFEFKLIKIQKWLPLMFILVLIGAAYFMIVIEPSQTKASLSLMGKENGSAGRSLQIIYLINNFKLSLWGGGRIINSIVQQHAFYNVHNTYLASFYILGIVISIAYIWFLYWLYKSSVSFKFKICLLMVQFYLFFEPGVFFSVQMLYFMPMFVLCANFYNHSVYNSRSQKPAHKKIPVLFNNL